MLLTWNLIARGSRTAAICFSHLGWAEDALRVYFTNSKTDQLGTHPRDPRHIYANPLQPELCPILSLGMFCLCYQYSSDDRHLFPGDKSQAGRFRDSLSRVIHIRAGWSLGQYKTATSDMLMLVIYTLGAYWPDYKLWSPNLLLRRRIFWCLPTSLQDFSRRPRLVVFRVYLRQPEQLVVLCWLHWSIMRTFSDQGCLLRILLCSRLSLQTPPPCVDCSSC